MSGSFFFEGNGFFDYSVLNNSSIGNSIITQTAINQSSIDMLNSAGNYQIITNHNYPINTHDVAIKGYVDNLGIIISNISLSSTQGSIINTSLIGSFIVTITPNILGGPSAIFNITKNLPTNCGHIIRTVMSPGTNNTYLLLYWPNNSGIYLNKTSASFDGNYSVKII